MQIFPQEITDGLEHQIKSSASVLIASQVTPDTSEHNPSLKNAFKALASYDDKDLYYTKSILVSSSWNKNDDIFDKAEVWVSKNTPEDKPTNLDHDEGLIVGHMISSIPVDEEGNVIAENTSIDDLPNKFHILAGSVIYKAFSNPELRSRAEKLISEIESGTKYVSMECLFKGFDYGVMDSEGNYKVLARNENTAYLTKYLRAYGGAGEHENYKIGRVLRQITFTGKGYVDKPANPDSIIILDNQEKNTELANSGVCTSQSNLKVETNTMSLEKEVADISAKLDQLATATTVKANVEELENTIKSQQETIAALEAEKVALAGGAEEYKKKSEEEYKKTKSELDSALETLAAYKNKEEEMMKKEKKMKRMASLLELGATAEIAESTADKFETLDDTAFEAMTSLLAATKPDWLKKKDEEKMKEDAKKAKSTENADPSILDTAEVEDNSLNLSVGSTTTSEEDHAHSTRAELIEFVCARLGKKLNKGE